MSKHFTQTCRGYMSTDLVGANLLSCDPPKHILQMFEHSLVGLSPCCTEGERRGKREKGRHELRMGWRGDANQALVVALLPLCSSPSSSCAGPCACVRMILLSLSLTNFLSSLPLLSLPLLSLPPLLSFLYGIGLSRYSHSQYFSNLLVFSLTATEFCNSTKRDVVEEGEEVRVR